MKGAVVRLLLGGTLIAVFGLAACSKEGAEKKVSPVSGDKIVASIDGTPVHASELAIAEQRFLGKVPPNMMNDEIKGNILDSLIRSKAMAMKMKSSLSEADSRELNAQVAAFREDLLVRKYIERNAGKIDITRDQIKEFYQSNPHLFGGGTRKKIEYIAVNPVDDRDKRVKLLNALNDGKTKGSWDDLAGKLKQQGYESTYFNNEVSVDALQSPLREVVAKLSQEDGPKLITETGIYLIKVVQVREVPGKPLAEVSADIQKMLYRKAYREAVKAVSDKVMEGVKVEKY